MRRIKKVICWFVGHKWEWKLDVLSREKGAWKSECLRCGETSKRREHDRAKGLVCRIVGHKYSEKKHHTWIWSGKLWGYWWCECLRCGYTKETEITEITEIKEKINE